MFLGCAYRRRTGACTCNNPPIGCVRDVPASAPGGGLSFPKGVTSYRELRLASQAAPQATAPPRPPPPDPAPRPAGFLPFELPVGGAHRLPTVGWRCTAGDAVAAAHAGVRLLHADGCADAETALGALTRAEGVVFSTSVAASPLEQLVPAVEAACTRMGHVDALLLRWTSDGEASGLEDAYAVAAERATQLGVRHVGLQCERCAAAPRCLSRLLAASHRPALLALALHPASGKYQRALLGACRRAGVRVIALSPTDATLAATPELAAAAATRSCAPEHAAADALLAWCVGREVIALPAAADHGIVLEHMAAFSSSSAVLDISKAERAALDAAGDALAVDV